jgi:hypothetical protein
MVHPGGEHAVARPGLPAPRSGTRLGYNFLNG